MKFKIFFLYLTLIQIGSSLKSNYSTQCRNRKYLSINASISIEGCNTSPCKVKRGSICNVTLNFTPTTQLTTIEVGVSTVVFWIRFYFPGLEVNGCKYLPEICPLEADKPEMFFLPLGIPWYAPQGVRDVRIELNSGKDHVLCYDTQVHIV
uniref:Ecdysteroid-regulated 16 kDa protein (Trinotate prediction) n=1 Tax=Myxobolus squamalis TaxID=59785 RepID=A0A6B2G451_MYXSQ